MVTIHTNYGVISVELFADKAPETVANFLSYAKEGFYDNTIFHRVIDGFMAVSYTHLTLPTTPYV